MSPRADPRALAEPPAPVEPQWAAPRTRSATRVRARRATSTATVRSMARSAFLRDARLMASRRRSASLLEAARATASATVPTERITSASRWRVARPGAFERHLDVAVPPKHMTALQGSHAKAVPASTAAPRATTSRIAPRTTSARLRRRPRPIDSAYASFAPVTKTRTAVVSAATAPTSMATSVSSARVSSEARVQRASTMIAPAPPRPFARRLGRARPPSAATTVSASRTATATRTAASFAVLSDRTGARSACPAPPLATLRTSARSNRCAPHLETAIPQAVRPARHHKEAT